jgi:hypothetical protein
MSTTNHKLELIVNENKKLEEFAQVWANFYGTSAAAARGTTSERPTRRASSPDNMDVS